VATFGLSEKIDAWLLDLQGPDKELILSAIHYVLKACSI